MQKLCSTSIFRATKSRDRADPDIRPREKPSKSQSKSRPKVDARNFAHGRRIHESFFTKFLWPRSLYGSRDAAAADRSLQLNTVRAAAGAERADPGKRASSARELRAWSLGRFHGFRFCA